MLNAEMTPAALAAAVDVDVKTVGRWLAEDRTPYPVTRIKIARILDQQETYLWPSLLGQPEGCAAAMSEIDGIWPTRAAISSATWHDLFTRTAKRLDILVYAGEFLIETLDLVEVLTLKADQGASIRILIGDGNSRAVRQRAEEESEPWLPDRCRSLARALSGVGQSRRVEVRLHDTTLYASHFRFDNVMLINGHAFGASDALSPVSRYRSATGAHLFDFYARAYERVWLASASGIELSAGDRTT